MNTLKVTKWFRFSLLCLLLLSVLLALAGLWAARGFQDRFSQVNPIQSEGKQMDVSIAGQKLAQMAPNTGMDPGELYLTDTAKVIDPSGRIRDRSDSSAVDPEQSGYQLTGARVVFDPNPSPPPPRV